MTRKLPDAVEADLSARYRAKLNPTDHLYSRDEFLAHAAEADAVLATISDKLTAPVFEILPPSVRMIATFSVGFDHIDIAAAKARGIVVTNTPDVLTDATADIAMLLLLGAARRAAEGDQMIRADQWPGWGPVHMMGTQVSGKRLGIVGLGRIGQAMARRARGFGMQVHYTDQARYPNDGEFPATYHAKADDMLPLCDFLSLHCPSTPATRGFVNRARIDRLPKGAIVVNSARGDLVDDEALIEALKSGRIAAAGLDVFAGEPKIHPGYRPLKNTFLLPHLGSATRETREAMGFRAVENIDAYFNGGAPRDRLC